MPIAVQLAREAAARLLAAGPGGRLAMVPADARVASEREERLRAARLRAGGGAGCPSLDEIVAAVGAPCPTVDDIARAVDRCDCSALEKVVDSVQTMISG
jgi:hypothetical protein